MPTVLDSFESSESVVTGHVASVEKIGEKQREYDTDYIRSTTVIVDKVYKGTLKPGDTLKMAQGGGADCIWTFDEKDIGTQYLFYLGQPTKGFTFGAGVTSATVFGKDNPTPTEPMYYVSGCGRSRGLERAWDDLAFLDNREKVQGKTRVSGTFRTWFDYGFKASDIKIKFVGKNKTLEATTNKDGFFELYDLPPGDYMAEIDIPIGFKLNDYMVKQTSTGFEPYDPAGEQKSRNEVPVRLAQGRHVALDLNFDIDTAITGRVLSPVGKPMKGVCVMAVSTELAEGDNRGHSTCTDEKGEFVIAEMAPGPYRLLANYDGQMSANAPFGVVYYPGVTGRADAGIITVEAGKYVTQRVIHVPQTLDLVSFKGKFLYSDGKPVADEWVKFVPDDSKHFDEMRQKTDVSGAFEFRLVKGATGKVSGDQYIYSEKFKDCPKVNEILKAIDRGSMAIKSNVVEVNSLQPIDMIEITLPFPGCRMVKR